MSNETPPQPTVIQRLQQQANAQTARGHTLAAAQTWEQVARLCPKDVTVWLAVGQAWFRHGASGRARHALATALTLAPHLHGVRAKLGMLCLDAGDLNTAAHCFAMVLKHRPRHPEAQTGLARVWLRQRKTEKARTLLAPLAAQGRPVAAVALYADLLLREAQPAEAKRLLERALVQCPATDISGRSLLLERRARACDALDATDEAFADWSAANQLTLQAFPTPRAPFPVDAIRRSYAEHQQLPKSQRHSELPVFIVGMPRSGTSLLEQMLDCHPHIQGVGEREALRRVSQHLGTPDHSYLQQTAALPVSQLDALHEQYITTLRDRLQPDITRAVDKMPHNFLYVGLLGQVLPGARVVHCVRDPIDTCFSCFRQRFGAGLRYTNDLRRLGRFYRDYAALMRHWEVVKPVPMITVHYEALVTDPEPVLRQVLSFLGMSWDAACLRPHANPRQVVTASAFEVRQPINTKSIGRARRYAAHLGPLYDELGMTKPSA